MYFRKIEWYLLLIKVYVLVTAVCEIRIQYNRRKEDILGLKHGIEKEIYIGDRILYGYLDTVEYSNWCTMQSSSE